MKMRLQLLIALLGLSSFASAQWNLGEFTVTSAPTNMEDIVFCFELCEGEETNACACGRDFTSRCAAKCAGYDDNEIQDSSCHEQHCRTEGASGASPCDEYSKCTALQQYVSYNGTCVGSTFSCVQTSLLLTCPMAMQNEGKGVCLLPGGERYYMPNTCFAQSLGLAAKELPCENYEEDGESKEPIFFYNEDALQYYYDFSNDTLMAEFGDVIREDTCDCNYDYNPVHARFPEFCLSFWNMCFRNCKKKKYDGRQDTYWADPFLTYGEGLCVDPCNEVGGAPYPCASEDNCYPIRNSARCFPSFGKQSSCGETCPDNDGTTEPANPVCVRVYAGVLVDNVYRGGGTVSAYTYRNSCLAQCEGFVQGDWEAGNCNDLAVSKCEQKCAGSSGGQVCATVEVPVALDTSSDSADNSDGTNVDDGDDGDLIAITYREEKQTVASACLAECLGWNEFDFGSCESQVVDLSASWYGFKQQRCADYGQDAGNGQNYARFCTDTCTDATLCSETAFGKSACEACGECAGSPVCLDQSQFATGWQGYQGKTPCSSYSEFASPSFYEYCEDIHQGADPAYAGQTGCSACGECAGSPACAGGFRGKNGIKCNAYSLQNVRLTCHTDFHTGSDVTFAGQNACTGCPNECAQNLVCSKQYGFIGNPVHDCDGYSGPASDFCNDIHLGKDSAYAGKTACQSCPMCATARPCKAAAAGFVGYDYRMCNEAYGPGQTNHYFCHEDKHLGQDPFYRGKTACEGCPGECGSFWKCNIPSVGFVGYKGSTCARYNKNAADSLYVHCAEDKHDGTDPAFNGKTACECSECSDMPACNAPKTGFVGYKKIDLCPDYNGEGQKWCRDKHTGEDAFYQGKDACASCGECNGADVCRDVFKGVEGECPAYANQQKRCADLHIGPSAAFDGFHACDVCNECTGAPVCQNAFSFNGAGCDKYAAGIAGSYHNFCNDVHNSKYPGASSWNGQSACTACSSQCAGSPAC